MRNFVVLLRVTNNFCMHNSTGNSKFTEDSNSKIEFYKRSFFNLIYNRISAGCTDGTFNERSRSNELLDEDKGNNSQLTTNDNLGTVRVHHADGSNTVQTVEEEYKGPAR